MKNELMRAVYRAVCTLAERVIFPCPTMEGLENLPEGPCVIVGNHAHMYGPIVAELYIPGDRAIWSNAEMMHLREVPDCAFRDFWSKKPLWSRWAYRLLSYLIAPLSVCVFNNAHCIEVYHDKRVMRTMRESLNRLREGARVIIFPEHEVAHNDIVWEFQEGFVYLARLFEKRTHEHLAFVPMYVAPQLRTVVFGRPLYHDMQTEPHEMCVALMDAITGLATSLPRHRVVPYPNIPKKDYPYSIAGKVNAP